MEHPVNKDGSFSRRWKDGNSQKPLYAVWRTMLQRCYNPKHNRYHRYGERGITVCDEWSEYPAFESWATAHGYESGVQIDRVDSGGPYSPANCRWVSPKIQQNNRENNRRITWKGETKTLAEWADDERCKVRYKTLHTRVQKLGWNFAASMTTPSARVSGRGEPLTAFGTTQSVTAWTTDTRCAVGSVKTLWKRINDGWPAEKALTKPVRPKKDGDLNPT